MADAVRDDYIGPREELEKLALHALAVLDMGPEATLTRLEIERLAVAALAALGISLTTAVDE